MLVDRRGPIIGTIFGALLRLEHSLRPPRNDSLHQLGIAAEGGRAFAGVEDAKSPARAGADIEQSPLTAKRRLHKGDAARDLLPLRCNSGGYAEVLEVHEVDDLERRREIDVGSAGIALFGNAEFDVQRSWGYMLDARSWMPGARC